MSFDVDIDLQSSFNPEDVFPAWARAIVVNAERIALHPCGVYPQAIAIDQLSTNSFEMLTAAIPYGKAEELGYFKLDMLHNTVYNNFECREEIEQLLELEPDWQLLWDTEVTSRLFQLSKHYDLLNKVKPRSVSELADALALIRPGKQELLPLYIKEREACRKLLYVKEEGGYAFKKSHAVAYALVIVLQLHLINAGIL